MVPSIGRKICCSNIHYMIMDKSWCSTTVLEFWSVKCNRWRHANYSSTQWVFNKNRLYPRGDWTVLIQRYRRMNIKLKVFYPLQDKAIYKMWLSVIVKSFTHKEDYWVSQLILQDISFFAKSSFWRNYRQKLQNFCWSA